MGDMGGKKRKLKARGSTDTSSTDLDSSGAVTSEEKRNMEVHSDSSIMDKLKQIEDKIDQNKLFLSEKIVAEVDKLRHEVFEVSRLNDQLTERLKKAEDKCAELQGDVEQTRNTLDMERERRNELDQYGRRENLRFVKLGPDSSSETTAQCEDKVLAVIKDKLKLGHISKQHISVAHRVGQFSKGYQRQIIVRA